MLPYRIPENYERSRFNPALSNQNASIFPPVFHQQQGLRDYSVIETGIGFFDFNNPPVSGLNGNENYRNFFCRSLNTVKPQSEPVEAKIESEVWDGLVDFIDQDRFFVNLVDPNSKHKIPKYQVEFKLNELPEESRSQLDIGSVVRWETGLKKGVNGEEFSFSELSLVNLPPISQHEMKRALDEADELLDGLNG